MEKKEKAEVYSAIRGLLASILGSRHSQHPLYVGVSRDEIIAIQSAFDNNDYAEVAVLLSRLGRKHSELSGVFQSLEINKREDRASQNKPRLKNARKVKAAETKKRHEEICKAVQKQIKENPKDSLFNNCTLVFRKYLDEKTGKPKRGWRRRTIYNIARRDKKLPVL